MTSLMRTLTAISVYGLSPWLFNRGVDAMRLVGGDADSEQTAAITSEISAGSSCRGCCSLI